jgi:hypothetical protein
MKPKHLPATVMTARQPTSPEDGPPLAHYVAKTEIHISHGELSLCPQQQDPPVARRDRRRPVRHSHQVVPYDDDTKGLPISLSAVAIRNDRGTNGPSIVVTHPASLNSPEARRHLGNPPHGKEPH